ncbi:serine/threonine-protein kinase [Yinghuangia soli]|uniref:Protein kinase n=1 Tax=Yinghuangia soli TaxID=2908204 RepID=A0AA41Q1B2_9ACTN|nr:serine/threonine-protein kinase [Yinghuangia soli]MCF2528951.1 protein kinase [Yinghuangia soli]
MGKFRLVGLLGAGGMGRVFLGRAPDGVAAAVKVVHPYLLNGDETEFRRRFVREVGAARRVGSGFTAAVLDADPDAAVPWLATEFVPGITLGDAVARFGPLPEESLTALASGLFTALSGVHGAGLVHRDIKPSNVMLDVDGPKVIDFGIARVAEATGLTRTGQTVGTLGFMSPEQFERSDVGPESDVFSVGAVLAYAATGRPPFPGDTLPVLFANLTTRPPDLDGLPAALAPLVEAALAKSPAARPTAEAARAMIPAPPTHVRADHGWLPPAATTAILRAASAALRTPGPATFADAKTTADVRAPAAESRRPGGDASPRVHPVAPRASVISEASPAPAAASRREAWERFGLPALVFALIMVSSDFWVADTEMWEHWAAAILIVRFCMVGLLVCTMTVNPGSSGFLRGVGYVFAATNAVGFYLGVMFGAGPTLAHSMPVFNTAIALSVVAYAYREVRTRRMRLAAA